MNSTKRIVRAFAPANISLVFETYDAEPPHGRGSLGIGITLAQGVIATVGGAGKPGIFVRGEQWEFPTVAQVARQLAPKPVRIELENAFPFGCGFGMSGASALATAHALNAHFSLGKSAHELGMVAHHAEVDHATGLGDVGGQCNGGYMIKTRKFEYLTVSKLPLRKRKLHVRVFGPIQTSTVINSREKLAFINAAGRRALGKISRLGKRLTLGTLLDESLEFANESRLLQSEKVRQCIAEVKAAGGHASMVMLGEALVADQPFLGSSAVDVVWHGPKLLRSATEP